MLRPFSCSKTFKNVQGLNLSQVISTIHLVVFRILRPLRALRDEALSDCRCGEVRYITHEGFRGRHWGQGSSQRIPSSRS